MKIFLAVFAAIIAAVFTLITLAQVSLEYQQKQELARMCKVLDTDSFAYAVSNCRTAVGPQQHAAKVAVEAKQKAEAKAKECPWHQVCR